MGAGFCTLEKRFSLGIVKYLFETGEEKKFHSHCYHKPLLDHGVRTLADSKVVEVTPLLRLCWRSNAHKDRSA